MKSHYPSADAWMEWKEKCASALCSDAARSDISGFVARTLTKRWGEIYRGIKPPQLGGGRDREIMQTFEIFMHAERRRKEGKAVGPKRWKDWMFDRAGVDPIMLGSSATKVVRTTVFRQFRYEEMGSAPMLDVTSLLEIAVGATGEDAVDDYGSVVDRLMDSSFAPTAPQLLEQEQRSETGKAYAEAFFEKMDFGERVVMLAVELGLKPYGEKITRLAGQSASTLQERMEGRKSDDSLARVPVRKFKKLWQRVRKTLPKETGGKSDRREKEELTNQVMVYLPGLALQWGAKDKKCAVFVRDNSQ